MEFIHDDVLIDIFERVGATLILRFVCRRWNVTIDKLGDSKKMAYKICLECISFGDYVTLLDYVLGNVNAPRKALNHAMKCSSFYGGLKTMIRSAILGADCFEVAMDLAAKGNECNTFSACLRICANINMTGHITNEDLVRISNSTIELTTAELGGLDVEHLITSNCTDCQAAYRGNVDILRICHSICPNFSNQAAYHAAHSGDLETFLICLDRVSDYRIQYGEHGMMGVIIDNKHWKLLDVCLILLVNYDREFIVTHEHLTEKQKESILLYKFSEKVFEESSEICQTRGYRNILRLLLTRGTDV